jgi:hypothetical protein
VAVTRGRAAAGNGGGSGDPPVRERQGTLRRRFTFDDALAAAEALREISAGHEEAAGVTIERRFICVEDFELLPWSAR